MTVSLVTDIFISRSIITQCPLFLLMSWCIVCLLPVILKTHRWQSTLSGVNRTFRSCWYGYALTLNVSPISVVLQALFCTHPFPPPDDCRDTHCMQTVKMDTQSGSSESIACPLCAVCIPCPFVCYLYQIPFMITRTNANPMTDAPACCSEAVGAPEQRLDWAKLCLALDLGPSWFLYRRLTFTWFLCSH